MLKKYLIYLNYLSNISAMFVLAVLMYNLFRVTSEDMLSIMKMEVSEQMSAENMDKFLKKYEFTAKSMQNNDYSYELHSTSRLFLGQCTHVVKFKIEANKVIQLNKHSTCQRQF